VRLLLDTCAFLWIVAGSSEISERARATCADPENELFLSAVSAWEIALKNAIGKLPLPEAAVHYVPSARTRHGIEPLPLDEEATLQLPKLPGLHRDPFDRMLICQAIAHGLDIVTPDPAITQYPVRTFW
jgi:PIN domain nuclease of toxin-antitoxin system